MQVINRFFWRSAAVILISASLGIQSAAAEDRWVTDEFEVMLRSGKSSKQRIIRQLKTGTRLEALKADDESGYTKVRIGDTEGWVLTRYLRASPTSAQRLPELQERLDKSEERRRTSSREAQGLREEKSTMQREIAELQSSNRSLQDQVDRITKLSSGTIQVDEENQQLKQQLAESEQRIDKLETENLSLSSRANREWFMVGGAVLTFGLLLGLILPRINWKKKSSWSDF